MTTRMVHTQHGAMHAYEASEIERLEKLGWEVESAAVLKAALAESMKGHAFAEPGELIALNVVDEPPKRKYVRKDK